MMISVSKSSGGRCAAGAVCLVLLAVLTPPQAGAASAAQQKDEIRQAIETKKKLMDQLFGELNLTAEQVAALEERRGRHLEMKELLLSRIAEKKEALRLALDEETPEPSVIDALTAELADLQTERLKNRVAAILDIKKILTPAQYSELRKKKKLLKEKHQDLWKDKTEEQF